MNILSLLKRKKQQPKEALSQEDIERLKKGFAMSPCMNQEQLISHLDEDAYLALKKYKNLGLDTQTGKLYSALWWADKKGSTIIP